MMKWQAKLKMAVIVAFCAGLVVLSYQFYSYVSEHREFRNWKTSVIHKLEQSRLNVPSTVTPDEWNDAIDRTGVALPNCFFTPRYIKNHERFREFSEALRKMDAAEIDLDTVRWIWDEIETTAVNGAQYSMEYRPNAVRQKESQ